MRSTLNLALAAAALVVTHQAADAKPFPQAGVTREEIIDYLKTQGLTATQQPDHNNRKILKTSIDGVNFDVYFFDCDDKDERCSSIQFAAGWSLVSPVDQEKLNGWNKDKRWMRAYLTGDNKQALYGEMDIIVGPGSTETLDNYVATWKVALPQFKTHFSL
jgi:hypothetical protein